MNPGLTWRLSVSLSPAGSYQQQTVKEAHDKVNVGVVGCHDDVPALREGLDGPDEPFLFFMGASRLRQEKKQGHVDARVEGRHRLLSLTLTFLQSLQANSSVSLFINQQF